MISRNIVLLSLKIDYVFANSADPESLLFSKIPGKGFQVKGLDIWRHPLSRLPKCKEIIMEFCNCSHACKHCISPLLVATGLSVCLYVYLRHFGIFLIHVSCSSWSNYNNILHICPHLQEYLKRAKVSENLLQGQGHSRGSKATCTDFFVHFWNFTYPYPLIQFLQYFTLIPTSLSWIRVNT